MKLECPWCKETCVSIDNFINHQKLHKEANINFHYLCNLCLYSTAKVSDMKRHLMRHYGLRPFKCQFRDYSSVLKGNVKIHLLSHISKNK